jgi:hypothetical protein
MNGDGETRDRALECDCGFVAHGGDDDELIVAVQAHAREAHHMSLPAELILALAGTKPRPLQ